jgi:ubiquinone/menaquinone biosynthesis C-methylase UbiE
MTILPRIPEADATQGAITDEVRLKMEQYSLFAKKFIGIEYRRFIDRLLVEFKLDSHACVLEIGPGPGWLTLWLGQKVPTIQITGLELSPDMIRVAEKNRVTTGVSNVQFIQGDAEIMDGLNDGAFDAVISNGSLHHWLDPVAVFNCIARVLKPGGLVAINDGRRDLNLAGKLLVGTFRTMMRLDPIASRPMIDGWKSSIAAGYTPAEIDEMLRRSRLADCRVSTDMLHVLIHR